MTCTVTFDNTATTSATQTVRMDFSATNGFYTRVEPIIEALLSPYFPTWWAGDSDSGALVPA